MNNKLPPQFYKPIIKRPQFHVFGQHTGTIRGTSKRCQWCSSLLNMREEMCPQCGATQIDTGYINLDVAPDWRKRIKGLGGNPSHGFSGN